jgi:PAS domain S-box-containing protein
MQDRSRVLVVDDDTERGRETVDALATPTTESQGDTAGEQPVSLADSLDDALSTIGATAIDCVVCERTVGDATAIDVLETIRSVHGDLPVVVCTEAGDEAFAGEVVARNVDEYVPRTGDWQSRLDAAVDRSLDTHRDRIGRLKERALDEAPVGITIADADDDVPLIYTNDSFVELTGYERSEVIGRNCRFLQGERSSDASIDEMRTAIDAREPVRTEILNYTADDEPFWNRVDIAPVSDGTGDVTHFVGFQTEITDRVEAERVATERADELAAERESLQHVLDRVDGLVRDTGQALVEATTRGGIESEMCSLLVANDPYTCAWIGEPDLAAKSIDPRTIVGGSSDDPPLDLTIDDGPVQRAIDTGDVQIAAADALEDWHREHVTESFATLAVVPLTYRDARYGVLCVYVDDADAFDDREATIVSALGRMVATAISAAETRRTLTADDVVSLSFTVRNRDAFFVQIAERADVSLSYAGSMSRDDDRLGMFFTVETDDCDGLEEIAGDVDEIVETTIVTANDGACLVEFEVQATGLLSTLADYGADIREVTASPGSATVDVELPRDANARSLVDHVEASFDDVELAAYRNRERPGATKQEFIATLEGELTDRQLTALRRAYYGEFFEWPRPTSGDDLAESMGIARSTFHQHLRAAERKLVGEFFDRP